MKNIVVKKWKNTRIITKVPHMQKSKEDYGWTWALLLLFQR